MFPMTPMGSLSEGTPKPEQLRCEKKMPQGTAETPGGKVTQLWAAHRDWIQRCWVLILGNTLNAVMGATLTTTFMRHSSTLETGKLYFCHHIFRWVEELSTKWAQISSIPGHSDFADNAVFTFQCYFLRPKAVFVECQFECSKFRFKILLWRPTQLPSHLAQLKIHNWVTPFLTGRRLHSARDDTKEKGKVSADSNWDQ